MSVQFCQVTFGYEGQPVLKQVSFCAPDGCLTALAGATGSGKSTLLKLSAGLLRPDAGDVLVDGEPLWRRRLWGMPRRDPQLPWRLGYVMQRPERQLFAPTVLEDVAFGPKNAGLSPSQATQAAREALELLAVGHLAERSPFELSGGQQRLVAMAGVLAMKPRNLVLDEPLSALDPHGRALVEHALCQLVNPAGALLMVCHDMDAIGSMASRMVVLDGGLVALDGTTSQVFSQAEKLYSLGLGVPAALSFARNLKDCYDIDLGAPLTQEALVRAVCARLSGGRP